MRPARGIRHMPASRQHTLVLWMREAGHISWRYPFRVQTPVPSAGVANAFCIYLFDFLCGLAALLHLEGVTQVGAGDRQGRPYIAPALRLCASYLSPMNNHARYSLTKKISDAIHTPMQIISLTTDFGQLDGFVGVMKGVIWGIAPEAHIADITHDIPAQNIRLGAYALWRAVPYFPPGSVHIAVVDPGVGTQRRAIGLKIGEQQFVVPDNGLITPILEDGKQTGQPIQIVHLNNPKYWLPHVSATFHGRDVFAPTGAHLATGVPLSAMGDPISDPIRLEFPRPIKTPTGYLAHITIIDIFGNLTTDLPAGLVPDPKRVRFRFKDHLIQGLVPSYGHSRPGDLLALVDSENYIEIAMANGSAEKVTGALVGDVVEVILDA